MKQTSTKIAINYSPKHKEGNKINGSGNAFQYLLKNWEKKNLRLYEEFKVILLNNANEVLGILSLCKGGMEARLDDVRILLPMILKSSAPSIITCHTSQI